MLRLALLPAGLASAVAVSSLLGCAPGPPPDEGKFKQAVAQILVEAAKRSGGTVDGNDPVKTIVFDDDSVPHAIQDVEPMVKQGLEGAGIAWVDADLQNDPRNLPGEWTTFRNYSTLRSNRTHSVVHVSVEGQGREREVEWRLVCGPVCGYGQRVRLQWSGETWSQSVVARIRY